MKKLSVLMLAVIFVLMAVPPVAFSTSPTQATVVNVERTASGSSQLASQATLTNIATGTTGTVTSNYAVFDFPMNNLTCDFISGPSSGTSNIVFGLRANGGSSTTVFDTQANFGLADFALASSASLTVMATKSIFVNKPFRVIQAVISSPTTTQVITINCSATK